MKWWLCMNEAFFWDDCKMNLWFPLILSVVFNMLSHVLTCIRALEIELFVFSYRIPSCDLEYIQYGLDEKRKSSSIYSNESQNIRAKLSCRFCACAFFFTERCVILDFIIWWHDVNVSSLSVSVEFLILLREFDVDHDSVVLTTRSVLTTRVILQISCLYILVRSCQGIWRILEIGCFRRRAGFWSRQCSNNSFLIRLD